MFPHIVRYRINNKQSKNNISSDHIKGIGSLEEGLTWFPPGQVFPVTEVLVLDVGAYPLHHPLLGELMGDEGR